MKVHSLQIWDPKLIKVPPGGLVISLLNLEKISRPQTGSNSRTLDLEASKYIQGDSKILLRTLGWISHSKNKEKKSTMQIFPNADPFMVCTFSRHQSFRFFSARHLKKLVYATCLKRECLQYKLIVSEGAMDKNPKHRGQESVEVM